MNEELVAAVKAWNEVLPRDLRRVFTEPGTREGLEAALVPHLADDFHMANYGPAGDPVERYSGYDGFVEGWDVWTSPYEAYEYEIVSHEEIGDALLSHAQQRAYLVAGGEPIEMPDVAALWIFERGKIAFAEFHLDRNRARRVANERISA